MIDNQRVIQCQSFFGRQCRGVVYEILYDNIIVFTAYVLIIGQRVDLLHPFDLFKRLCQCQYGLYRFWSENTLFVFKRNDKRIIPAKGISKCIVRGDDLGIGIEPDAVTPLIGDIFKRIGE